MTRKNLIVFIESMVALLLILACATTPVAPTLQPVRPVSTANPDAFSTMVAQVAGALLTQTAAARPASPSPPPSLPPPPTEILPPTPTETPVSSLSGTSLSQLEDGSTQFEDEIAGIRLTIPAGWVTVRLNEPEYYQIWSLTVDDPILQQDLDGIQNLDPARYRLHAFNTQPDYVYEETGSRITVVYDRDDTRTLEQVAEDEKGPKVFTDYVLIYSEFQVRPDGLETFIIDEQWQGLSSTNAPVMIYNRGVVFKVASGTVLVSLTIPADIGYKVAPGFDQMIEQMTVFTP